MLIHLNTEEEERRIHTAKSQGIRVRNLNVPTQSWAHLTCDESQTEQTGTLVALQAEYACLKYSAQIHGSRI